MHSATSKCRGDNYNNFSKKESHNRYKSFTWSEAEACQQRETVLWRDLVEFVCE